jgi:ParB-like chromosome segregation protein Spo0J
MKSKQVKKTSAAVKQRRHKPQTEQVQPTHIGHKALMFDINALKPYDKNARTHGDEQIELIAKSIERFGWTQPIVVDSNNVIVIGHARYMAARLLAQNNRTARGESLSHIPCVIADDLTEEEIRALRIADNKLASMSEWDIELLAADMQQLQAADLLDITGFSVAELRNIAGVFSGDDHSTERSVPRNLVLVDCLNEEVQQNLFEELKQRGLECKLMN